MLFVPLPIVVSTLLLVLFLFCLRRDETRQANRPFLVLILVSAILSLINGLRWGYGLNVVGLIAPPIVAMVPPLAYSGVACLVRKDDLPMRGQFLLFALPVISVLLTMLFWPAFIDLAIIILFVGFAIAVLFLMRSGPDALRRTPFETTWQAYRAILFAAGALLLSAGTDSFIALDLMYFHGGHVQLAVMIGNLLSLIILATAAATVLHSRVPEETSAQTSSQVEEDDRDVIQAVETTLERNRLYRDADLSLDRLARRAGIPARQISGAINRMTGKNVSQFVNERRIAAACDLLRTTDKPITEIMFEAGFQTKSNFNREFRRVTDMAPSAWREKMSVQGLNHD